MTIRQDPDESTPVTIDEATMKCRRLWIGVLNQAMLDLERVHRTWDVTTQTARRSEVYIWMFLTNDVRPGSFIWICNILDKDPEAMRRRAMSKLKGVQQ